MIRKMKIKHIFILLIINITDDTLFKLMSGRMYLVMRSFWTREINDSNVTRHRERKIGDRVLRGTCTQ